MQIHPLTNLRACTVWDVERRLENLATAYFKEKQHIEASLLSINRAKIEQIQHDYNTLAMYHFDRFDPLGIYDYYSIPQ